MSLLRSAVNFEEKWKDVRDTIGRVMQLQRVNMAKWNDDYSDIYALCEAFPTPYDKKLYKKTQSHLRELVEEMYQYLSSLEHHAMLSGYQKCWLSYHQGTHYLNNLFSYFNRVPLRKYRTRESSEFSVQGMVIQEDVRVSGEKPVEIRNMSLCVWREGMMEKICSPLIRSVLEEIRRDRNGETADLSMVRDVVFSFIEVEAYNKDSTLRYYQESFENAFLKETGEYYCQVASKLVCELNVSQYMAEVVSRLQTAKRRGQKFLHQSSITKFIRECEARLVEKYKDDYLNLHIQKMIQEERIQDLKNLFLLLSGIPHALTPLRKEFEERVTAQGFAALSQVNMDKQNPNVGEFMASILSTHSHYSQLIDDVFSSNKEFCSSLDKACRVFVNAKGKSKQHPRAPMLLARYCDQLLKKSSKGIGDEEVEEHLEEAITVFRYLDDKDVFQRFYSRMLSRRLVQGLSLSMEVEEGMIQKLKHACGYEYTARLQRMVVDIKLSEDCMTAFQDSLSLSPSPSTLPISFSTLVLQSAAWPLTCVAGHFSVPDELKPVISKFEQFYEAKYTGRKLAWLHHLSLGDLKMCYLKKPYTVTVTTFQMALLLVFNAAEKHTYSFLQKETLLTSHELSTTLQSLLDSRILILEEGQSLDHGGDCLVCLNKSYTNKRTKFKITAALQRETQQEVEQTQASAQEDRKLHIQAAIVRIMKARKSLKHNQLIEETIQQVRSRFIPNIQMIKRCVETLIERQYLERKENSKDSYNYVA